MPTYVYKREDGTTFEAQQRITEDALETCPDTGQAVKRVMQPAASHFKGSGFYLTDYARKKESGKEDKGGEKKENAKSEASSSGEGKSAANGSSSEGKSAKPEKSAAE